MQVKQRPRELQLALLVGPTVHILAKPAALAALRIRGVDDAPLVVHPHVMTIKMQVKGIITVFSPRDPRVKGHVEEGVAMQCHNAAQGMTAAHQARAALHRGHPSVEGIGLEPVLVVPLAANGSKPGALDVSTKARLCDDGRTLASLFAQAIEGFGQKVRVIDDFVVIHEDEGVGAHKQGHHQAQVPHGAVSGEANLILDGEAQTADAPFEGCRLGFADHGYVQIGEEGGDFAVLGRRLVSDGGLGDHGNDDFPQATDGFE